MGNGCICIRNLCFEDIKVETFIEEQNHPTDSNLYNNIVKYFDDFERDITIKLEKRNLKKILSFKRIKNLNTLRSVENNKYELMLKRLLEQKKIERKGPKRRETIRINNNKELIHLVKESIEDNKKKENNKENNKNNTPKKETILIKNNINLHAKHSVIVGKVSKKKIIDNFDENRLLNHETKLTSGNLVNNKKKV
jgi:hypothetical protein